MSGVSVWIEYETIPDRHKECETLVIPGGHVCFTTVIKELTGLDVTGCKKDDLYNWYYCPWDDLRTVDVPALLVLKKLHISGSSCEICQDGSKSVPWLAGNTFRASPELEEVIIDSDCREIGNAAFFSCKALRKVVVPDSVEKIERDAFGGCSALDSFVFPSHLKYIGLGAFKDCSKLKTAILPDTLAFISHDVFSGCDSLECISIPSDIKSIQDIGCNNRDLIVACDRGDKEGEPLERAIGNRRYMCTPRTINGVKELCHLQTIDDAQHKEAVETARTAAVAGRFTGNVDGITDAETLLKYLKLASEAETSVMQLTEAFALALSTRGRLEEMLERRKSLDACLSKQQAEIQRERFKESQNRWAAERDAISNGERLSTRDTGAEPSRPQMMSEPAKPTAPELRKPGLFNRKRIEAENAEAERLYQEALAAYEAELSWVRDENAKTDSEYKKQVAAWRRRRTAAIKRQLDELGPQPSDRPKRSKADSDVTKALKAAVSAAKAMCKELEKKLVEASGLLKLAYSADVIFPKYRNIEAMTTMYEYFETGRCTSLKGPDGAYNLYESELRSNAIIGRLDVVSDKLDRISDQLSTIQANQYVLYKAVEGVSERLDAMSTTLGEILSETKSTGQTAREISAKASAMVRNSAEIAYWARKNAELTDSLGYLIAFAAL